MSARYDRFALNAAAKRNVYKFTFGLPVVYIRAGFRGRFRRKSLHGVIGRVTSGMVAAHGRDRTQLTDSDFRGVDRTRPENLLLKYSIYRLFGIFAM